MLHKYPDSKNKQRKGIGVEWHKRSAGEGEARRRKVLWVTQQDSGYDKLLEKPESSTREQVLTTAQTSHRHYPASWCRAAGLQILLACG